MITYIIKYELNGETLYTRKNDVNSWKIFMWNQGLEIEILQITQVHTRLSQLLAQARAS